MTMRACASCERHYLAAETACPFCRMDPAPQPAAGPSLMRRLALGGAMLFTAATATACYGTPPIPNELLIPSNFPSTAPSGVSPTAPNPSPTPPPKS